MIRMTLALSVALYAGLVIWGDPVIQATAATSAGATDAAVTRALATGPDYEIPVILDDGAEAGPQVTRAAVSRTVVPEAAAIAAAAGPRAQGEPVLVSLVPRDTPASTPPTAAVSSDGGSRLRVAGDRVNMRAGPSTADAVVGSLAAGTLAEPISEARGGWMEIRVVETGQTGYMAARFLDPT